MEGFGNGFQVEQRDVDSFPLLTSLLRRRRDSPKHSSIRKKTVLYSSATPEKTFLTSTTTMLKAWFVKSMMRSSKPYTLENLAEVFISKTNSLHNKMDALVGYGGQNED